MSNLKNIILPNVDTNEEEKAELPYIVLDGPFDCKVYLIGTAHFSHQSQKEVAELIRKVQPNRVVLELCSSRVNILKYDEETLMKEYKEMDTNAMIQNMKQTSVVQGLLQALMIRLYGKITEQLGMAPGGEFRVAYREALNIPGCKVILGDMPVNITLKRAFNSLPWYRKVKLAFCFLLTDHRITIEDIEALKKKDMLEAMMAEFGTEFPEFKKVLIDERNQFLAHSLKKAYAPIPNEFVAGGFLPARVVGVVGLGHVEGIKEIWNKEFDINEILKEPKKSKLGFYIKRSIFVGTLAIVGFKIFRKFY